MDYKTKLKSWKTSYVFSNGMQLWYRQTDTLTSVLYGIIDAGSRHDGDKRGIAHFTEHLLFDGNSSMSGRALKEFAANNGLDINAGTSKEFMTVEVGDILPEKLPEAVEILYQTMIKADFNGEDFDREKRVVISEIGDAEDRALSKAMEQVAGMLLADKYRYPVLGNAESVSSITKEDVRAFYARTFRPENMVICYAGSKSADEVAREVSQKLKWEDNDLTWSQSNSDIELQFNQMDTVFDGNGFEWKEEVDRQGQRQVAVAFGYKGLSSHLDEDTISLSLATKIFGGGVMTSRMFRRLREEKGLCYWAGGKVSNFIDEQGLIALLGTTNSENYKTFISELQQLVDEVRTTAPFTQQELDAAKLCEKAGLLKIFDSFSSSVNLFMHSYITANKLALADELEKIEKTTLQDVQSAFNKYFAEAPVIVAVGSLNENAADEPQEKEQELMNADRPTPAGSHATTPNSVTPPYAAPPIKEENELQPSIVDEEKPDDESEDIDEETGLEDAEVNTMPLEESQCAGCGKPFLHIAGVAVKKCPECKVQDVEGAVRKPVEHVSLYGLDGNEVLGKAQQVVILDDKVDFSNADMCDSLLLEGAKSEGKDFGSKASSQLKPASAPPPVTPSGKKNDGAPEPTAGAEKAGGKDKYKPTGMGGGSAEADAAAEEEADRAAVEKQNEIEAEMEMAGVEATGGRGSAWNPEDHPRNPDSGRFIDAE
jgi:predicted Zn-dependent peptidase/predicted Zn-ribbon and HTH transcriptional regulator